MHSMKLDEVRLKLQIEEHEVVPKIRRSSLSGIPRNGILQGDRNSGTVVSFGKEKHAFTRDSYWS